MVPTGIGSLDYYCEGGDMRPIRHDEQRVAVCTLLCLQPDLSLSEIARQVGVNKSTVSRYRKEMERKGVTFVEDGRKGRAGRKPMYGDVWSRIEAFRDSHKGAGGAEIWANLVGTDGLTSADLPSVSRINSYLSGKGLTHREPTSKVDPRPFFQEPATAHGVRCQMDEKYPLVNARGQAVRTINVRDVFSGAVYSEPMVMGMRNAPAEFSKIGAATFVGVFRRYCEAFGLPQAVRLDNGFQVVTKGGELPLMARWCINQGVVCEWEPPARPYKNGTIERWHRDIDKWWGWMRHECHSWEQSMQEVRKRALFINVKWPRRQLGDRPVNEVLAWKPWKPDASDCSPLRVEDIPRGGCTQEGMIRFYREVEQHGVVALHGGDHFRVQPCLAGSYVRVDMLVKPDGVPGTLSVLTGKGELVATGVHHYDADDRKGLPLITDLRYYGFEFETPQPAGYDQDAHNRQQERVSKSKRNRKLYEATGTASSMYAKEG